MKNRRRFEGGSLEVRLSVKKGQSIKEISFSGDFLGKRSLHEIEEDLKGCLLKKEHAAMILEKYPLSEYFGAISKEEILETIFNG